MQKILYRTWDAASSGTRLRKDFLYDPCTSNNKKTKKPKLSSGLLYGIRYFASSRFAPKKRGDTHSNPDENLVFFVFLNCFCMDPIAYPYASGSLRRPHPTYGIGSFAYTFSTLQKTSLLSEITYDILTQAGPKNLPKNWIFFGTGSRRGGGNGVGWDGMGWNGM